MVGAANIVANCLRGVFAEKDCSRVSDTGKEGLGVGSGDLQMLGGYPVGQR